MNTLENNKLIAEFLGYETYEMNGVLNVHYSENNIRTIQDTYYHADWNWLMEVVEKIEKVGEKELKFSVEFEKVKLSSNIESVYNACIEFIKWYNENKI